jgi:hypothetical protein
MLSFALLGGMLVGGRQAPKPPMAEPTAKPAGRK